MIAVAALGHDTFKGLELGAVGERVCRELRREKFDARSRWQQQVVEGSYGPTPARSWECVLKKLDPFQPFSRSFRLWMYVVSHRSLLLRSIRTELEPTRIDVAFVQVDEVYMPTSLDSLEISAPLHTPSTDVPRVTLESHAGARKFRLQRDSEWYVIASSCAAAMDDKGEFERSQFSFPRLFWD